MKLPRLSWLLAFSLIAAVPSVRAQSQFNLMDVISRFISRQTVTLTAKTPAGPVRIVADNTFDGSTGGIDATVTLPNGNTTSVTASINVNPGTSASVTGSITAPSGASSSFSGTATPSAGGVSISSSYTPPSGVTETDTVTIAPPEDGADILGTGFFNSLLKRLRGKNGP